MPADAPVKVPQLNFQLQKLRSRYFGRAELFRILSVLFKFEFSAQSERGTEYQHGVRKRDVSVPVRIAERGSFGRKLCRSECAPHHEQRIRRRHNAVPVRIAGNIRFAAVNENPPALRLRLFIGFDRRIPTP